MNKKYNVLSIFFYIIILLYILGVTYMIFGYFSGNLFPQKIPTDWWSALGVVVTLTLAILIMNFIRERDYLDIQNKITDFKKEIENAKQLSSLSTILLDIATEENSNKEKWEKNYSNIEKLYKIGFIEDIELYRISLEAWKQDDIFFAFKLRKLAYNNNSMKVKNRLHFLSILTYVDFPTINQNNIDNIDKRMYNDSVLFLKEIGFVKTKNTPLTYSLDGFFNNFPKVSNTNETYAYALAGRYLFKRKKYEDSLYFFKLAIKISDTFKRWHFRYLLELNLLNNDISILEENLTFIKDKKEWNEDYSYIAFYNLMDNIVRIINGKQAKKLNLLILIKGAEIKHFDRFSMWNFTSIIKQLSVDENKKSKILKLYKDYYVFFGADDKDFEKEFSINNLEFEKENILNKIILNK